MDLLIWGGPVYAPGSSPYAAGDVGKVQWERPTDIVTFSHGAGGGIGSDAFSGLASSFRDADGRILPRLLASTGRDIASYEQIAIAGFSAFHGLANQLLGSDGDYIDAAVLLDSCFETPGSAPKAGYASFAERAARGDRLMVFTASSGQNGPGLPPTTHGYDCAFAAANLGAARAGNPLTQESVPEGIIPPKCGAFQAGGLWVLNYCDAYLHGDHINALSVKVLQHLLAPYLGDAQSGATPGHHGGFWSRYWPVLAVGGVVLTAGLGVAAARSNALRAA
jgi:hypothetical protein